MQLLSAAALSLLIERLWSMSVIVALRQARQSHAYADQRVVVPARLRQGKQPRSRPP